LIFPIQLYYKKYALLPEGKENGVKIMMIVLERENYVTIQLGVGLVLILILLILNQKVIIVFVVFSPYVRFMEFVNDIEARYNSYN
jgi:hypothetical protein